MPVGAPEEGLYALRPDAKQLSEAELRKLVGGGWRHRAAQAVPRAPTATVA